MSTPFPTSKDTTSTLPVESSTTPLSTNHIVNHTNVRDAVIALQDKVGITSSADTASHDYKLGEVTSTDKAVGKSATQTLTNKTFTSPVINVGSDATGDMYYRNGSGVLTRLPVGTTGQVVTISSGFPTYATPAAATDASYAAKGVVQGLTDASTSGLTIAAGVISVNSGTGANNIVKLNGSAQLPAVDASLLTSTPISAIASNNVKLAHDAVFTNTGAGLILVKSIRTLVTGTIRVSYDYAAGYVGPAFNFRIYKNGVAFGTNRTSTSTSYVNWSEDLFFSAGDVIQLYSEGGSPGTNVRNFRIAYDLGQPTPTILV
jgi:hypothetical protein